MTRDFLGWDVPAVHLGMDASAAMLGGRHRVVGHDARTIRAMEALYGWRGRVVSFCHLMEDVGVIVKGCSGTSGREGGT